MLMMFYDGFGGGESNPRDTSPRYSRERNCTTADALSFLENGALLGTFLLRAPLSSRTLNPQIPIHVLTCQGHRATRIHLQYHPQNQDNEAPNKGLLGGVEARAWAHALKRQELNVEAPTAAVTPKTRDALVGASLRQVAPISPFEDEV